MHHFVSDNISRGIIVAEVLLLAQFGVLAQAQAQAPTFSWALKSGGATNDYGNAITVDPSGNAYVAGSFSASANFGTTNVNSAGLDDAFVAKYDNLGNLLWVRTAGGTTNDAAYAVCADGLGNCCVAGSYANSANFSGTNLSGFGGEDIFIAQYTSAGDLAWTRRAGGTGDDRGGAIAVDSGRNVYVTGAFNATATFDTTNLMTLGVYDIFVAKYSSEGNLVWVRQAGGAMDEYGTGIAVDDAQNCYVTGHFASSTMTIDTITLTNQGGRDIFIAKYDAGGNLLWVRQAGGSGFDIATAIQVDSMGNSHVGGYFHGTANFAGTSLNSAGFADLFAAKYDSAGNLLWVRSAGGEGSDYAYGIALNSAGDCLVTGGFSGTVAFGTNTFTGGGIMVLKYNASGQIIWAKQAARDAGEDYAFAIATDPAGNCYLTGFLDGNPTTFDSIFVTNTAAADIIVARLDVPTDPPLLSIRQQGNQVTVSWSTNNAGGFTLYYATNLIGSPVWTAMSPAPIVSNQYVRTDLLSGAERYYRLKQ